MRISSVVMLLGSMFSAARAAGLMDLAAQVPACGLQCIQQSLPQSPCTMEDSECLCTNEVFAGLTQQCVAVSCSMKEALTLMRIQNLGCGVPVESQQTRFKAHAIVACVLAEIAVILRIYSKLRIVRKLKAEDYLIMIAAIATVPYLYLHCTLADLGFGLNIWDVQPFDHLYKLLNLFWIDQMMYSVHLYSTKLSILCFLMSIFPSRSFKKMVIGVGIFVALSGAATLITTGLQCLPASYNSTSWDGEHEGHCNDLNTQTYAFGAINMVCDLFVLIMPLPELWKLQVKSRQKIQLLVMFSLGLVVTIFSIMRLPYLVTLGKTTNPTWEYVEVTIWSIWETELGMICASMPAIRHLFKFMFPDAMGTIKGMVSSYGGQSYGENTKKSEYARSGTRSGNWSDSKSRTNNDTKGFYELDEHSLIDKEEASNNGGATTPSGAERKEISMA